MTKKLYLFTCLTLIAMAGQAQHKAIFYLGSLHKADTLLTGWRFHAGDNIQWAAQFANDDEWRAIDPSKDITDLSQVTHSSIGWIRLHIKIDSTLDDRQLVAWIYQYTATEVYIDGKLVKKFGLISEDPSKSVALCPDRSPFIINLKSGREHVIAVRLASQPHIIYVSPLYLPLSVFAMYLNGSQHANENYNNARSTINKNTITVSILTGVFFIISFINFLYFFFDRRQKVNLYYAFYSLILCIDNAISIPYYNNIENVSAQMLVALSFSVLWIVAHLFLTLTVYSLFNYKRRTVFIGLVTLSIAVFVWQYFSDVTAYIACTVIFPVVCMFECVRVSILAAKEKKKDALLILGGLCTCIGSSIAAVSLDQTTTYATIFMGIVMLSFPIGMSLYLGVQNAITNRTLRDNLDEIEALSLQKQQLLANQNQTLEIQVSERTAELNQSLTHLKQTQTQLIQSEKMASLGELTAGIAHEIQNPLNFVNNFSEVSVELLAELKEEEAKGNKEDVIAIADDLTQNLEKIRHHGKRADAIVKGMLQHSQSGSGTKEPTNINSLADEYLRLSYHGLRSKDKSFNAEMVTHFDEKLPQINVIPQDIGRVMLNLFNNAFYAVNQKAKTAGADYKPNVSVTTLTENGHLVIKVNDNGNGIPDAIKDKIMQPFFTTKPTGEGTGLGLSLTYDMVVKGHGGSITVDTNEGDFTEFIISLPA